MKKFLAVLVGAVLVCSTVALSACGGGKPEGVIEGNYVAATEDSFSEALKDVNVENIFGDPSKDGFKFGFKVDADVSASIKMGDAMSQDVSAKANFAITAGSLELDDIEGAGEATVGMTQKVSVGEQSQEVKSNYSGKAYIGAEEDGVYAYGLLDAGEQSPLKAKVNLFALMGEMLPMALADEAEAPTSPAPGDDVEMEMGEGLSFAEIYKLLVANKVDVSMDTADGVKIKLSATQDTVWAIVSNFVSSEEVAEIKKSVTVNAFKLDVYLALDKDNVFSALGVDANVDVVVKPDAEAGIASEISVKVNGYVKVTAYTGSITMPSGMTKADLANYPDVTEDLVGGGEKPMPEIPGYDE